jgi:hypothetical protein
VVDVRHHTRYDFATIEDTVPVAVQKRPRRNLTAIRNRVAIAVLVDSSGEVDAVIDAVMVTVELRVEARGRDLACLAVAVKVGADYQILEFERPMYGE